MVQFAKEFDYIKIKLASPFRILQWQIEITKWAICW
jgi:DNA-directed RNA polymerase beta' subunit